MKSAETDSIALSSLHDGIQNHLPVILLVPQHDTTPMAQKCRFESSLFKSPESSTNSFCPSRSDCHLPPNPFFRLAPPISLKFGSKLFWRPRFRQTLSPPVLLRCGKQNVGCCGRRFHGLMTKRMGGGEPRMASPMHSAPGDSLCTPATHLTQSLSVQRTTISNHWLRKKRPRIDGSSRLPVKNCFANASKARVYAQNPDFFHKTTGTAVSHLELKSLTWQPY